MSFNDVFLHLNRTDLGGSGDAPIDRALLRRLQNHAPEVLPLVGQRGVGDRAFGLNRYQVIIPANTGNRQAGAG